MRKHHQMGVLNTRNFSFVILESNNKVSAILLEALLAPRQLAASRGCPHMACLPSVPADSLLSLHPPVGTPVILSYTLMT